MEVVGGIILGRNRKFLVTKRATKPTDPFASACWEFPGGKIERGETKPQALARELREELGIAARDFRYIATTISPDGRLNLHLLSCHYDGEIIPTEHQAWAWADGKSVVNFKFCPTDGRFVRDQLPNLLEKIMTTNP